MTGLRSVGVDFWSSLSYDTPWSVGTDEIYESLSENKSCYIQTNMTINCIVTRIRRRRKGKSLGFGSRPTPTLGLPDSLVSSLSLFLYRRENHFVGRGHVTREGRGGNGPHLRNINIVKYVSSSCHDEYQYLLPGLLPVQDDVPGPG